MVELSISSGGAYDAGASDYQWKEFSNLGEGHVRMTLVEFDEDVVSKAVHDSIPDSPKAPIEIFPNWQPVKCSYCWWHGPASKSIKWFGDTAQTCPNCGRDVVKHVSEGTNP